MELVPDAQAPRRNSVSYPPSTLVLNEATARLRMKAVRIYENHQRIARDYPKVSVGGLLNANQQLANDMMGVAERISGICWNSINESHPEVEQLSGEQGAAIAAEPPNWLRSVFSSARLMTGQATEQSLDGLAGSGRVMVLRDEQMRGSTGLLSNDAAIMPAGFTSDEVLIWWPWMMSGDTPVMLKTTERANVLQEFTVDSLEADEKDVVAE